MIHFVTGDMFDRPADIRVNTVNCVGVMGKGIALAFKRRYPKMFTEYKRACRSGEVVPGKLHIYDVTESYTIINFPTKRHWIDGSRYEDIEAGLAALRLYLNQLGRVHVTLPALGCGLGGLDWGKVKTMIEISLKGLFAEVYVYQPEDSR